MRDERPRGPPKAEAGMAAGLARLPSPHVKGGLVQEGQVERRLPAHGRCLVEADGDVKYLAHAILHVGPFALCWERPSGETREPWPHRRRHPHPPPPARRLPTWTKRRFRLCGAEWPPALVGGVALQPAEIQGEHSLRVLVLHTEAIDLRARARGDQISTGPAAARPAAGRGAAWPHHRTLRPWSRPP